MTKHRGNEVHYPKGTSRGGQFAPKGAGEVIRAQEEKYIEKCRKSNKFIPATSISEARKYAKNILGVKPYYDKLSLDTCNAINQSVTEMFEQFPQTRQFCKVVGNAQSINREMKSALYPMYWNFYASYSPYKGDDKVKEYTEKTINMCIGQISDQTVAYTNNYIVKYKKAQKCLDCYRGILVNQKYGIDANFDEKAEEQIKRKFHPEGTATMKAQIDHECGHIIDHAYNITGHEGYAPKDVKNEKSSQKIAKMYQNYSDFDIEMGLSMYAATDEREFIAEAWSEYKNNPHPRKIAKTVGRIISKYQ